MHDHSLATGVDEDDDLIDGDDGDEEANAADGNDKHTHLCN